MGAGRGGEHGFIVLRVKSGGGTMARRRRRSRSGRAHSRCVLGASCAWSFMPDWAEEPGRLRHWIVRTRDWRLEAELGGDRSVAAGFRVSKITKAKYEGKVNAAGTEATGTWSQRGASLPLTFVKKDKVTPEPKVVGKEQIWEGKLDVGPGLELRLVVRVQKTEDGRLLGKFRQSGSGRKEAEARFGHAGEDENSRSR